MRRYLGMLIPLCACQPNPAPAPEKAAEETTSPSARGAVNELVRVSARVIKAAPTGPAHDLVALDFQIEDGWHIYWTNPGDSGLATTAAFVPSGPSFEPFPAPERFLAAGDIETYGYSESLTLFAELPPGSPDQGQSPTEIKTSWLACKGGCVKGGATVTLDPARPQQSGLSAEDRLTRTRLPRGFAEFPGRFARQGQRIVLTLDQGSERVTDFFPLDPGHVALEKQVQQPTGLELEFRGLATPSTTSDPVILGLVAVEAPKGEIRYYELPDRPPAGAETTP